MVDLDKAGLSRLFQSLKAVRRRKGRIGALFFLGIFALMLISSMSVLVSSNEIQPSFIPFSPEKTFALSASSEWLDANAFDATYPLNPITGWTGTGASPYIDAQDQPTNIISTNINGATPIGWFDFPSTTLTGTLTVNISIYCNNDDGSANDRADVYVDFTGGAGSDIGDAAQHTSYSYDTFTVTGCDTVAEVNALRVYFGYTKVTGADDVRIDHVRLGVSGSSGTDYEEFLHETITAADVKTTAVDYDRSYTESVSAVDVKTTVADFARNLVEAISVVGIISVAKLTTKDMIETVTASDVRTTAVEYVRNRIESISASDVIARGIGINLSESISVVDVRTISKFITQNMVETITASDVRTTAVEYVRNRIESISAIDAQSNAAAYVRDIVESINANDVIDTVKSGGTDYEKNLTEVISVTIPRNGSLFYQLFFSLNMWGYFGPIALVIGGFLITQKEKPLGIFFIIVDSLVIATYLSLIEITPDYWWNVIILLLGVMITVGQVFSDR